MGMVNSEAASFSAYTDCFVNIPLPAIRVETNETRRDRDDNTGMRETSDGA